MRAFVLTAATMVAFAGNSLLCRAALGEARIGPVGFTSLRLAAGALTLAAVVRLTRLRAPTAPDSDPPRWASAAALIIYALAFSLAYLWLDAGTGALILFAAVQLTMVGRAVTEGERPTVRTWAGSIIAFGGLAALVWPGVSAPDPIGAGAMALAGIGWGLYSLYGRGAASPVRVNATNFARAAPLALIALPIATFAMRTESLDDWSGAGVILAITSGAVTSGLGYALWYRALRHLTTTTAAVAQLSVPVIAAAGGVLWLGEVLSPRMLVASAITLAGIALASVPAREPTK